MAGNAASLGFVSQELETELGELPVDGSLPEWLGGALIRTGPAKWEVGRRTMNHWFDGLAMLHRFGIADGRVTYASRFLETKAYRAARDRGELRYSEFATDPCRGSSSAWRAVLAAADRQRQRQPDPARRALHRNAAPRRRSRFSSTARRSPPREWPTRSRASSRPPTRTSTGRAAGCSTTRPSSDRAASTGSSGSARMPPSRRWSRRRRPASRPTCTRSASPSVGSCSPSSRSSSTRSHSCSRAARTSRTTAGSPSAGRG